MVSTQNGSIRHFKDKLLLVCSGYLHLIICHYGLEQSCVQMWREKLQKNASLCKIIRLIVLDIEGWFFIDTNMVE